MSFAVFFVFPRAFFCSDNFLDVCFINNFLCENCNQVKSKTKVEDLLSQQRLRQRHISICVLRKKKWLYKMQLILYKFLLNAILTLHSTKFCVNTQSLFSYYKNGSFITLVHKLRLNYINRHDLCMINVVLRVLLFDSNLYHSYYFAMIFS